MDLSIHFNVYFQAPPAKKIKNTQHAIKKKLFIKTIFLGADFKNIKTKKQEFDQEYYCFPVEQFF